MIDQKVQFDPTQSDPLMEIARKAGFTMKEPNTSIAIFRQESATVFRVICFECITQYDVFGVLKPAEQNGGEDCTVVQRILEHFGNCALRSRPVHTFIAQHRITGIFKMTVTWAADATAAIPTIARPTLVTP
jgi:hypothetical protein